jgi:hypothetical protein
MSKRLFTLSNPFSESNFLSFFSRWRGLACSISQGVWCSLIYRSISSISLFENPSLEKSSLAKTAEEYL